MQRKFMIEKYKKAVNALAVFHDVDIDVAYDMLVSSVKNHFGVRYTDGYGRKLLYDHYAGIPASFDYDEFVIDMFRG